MRRISLVVAAFLTIACTDNPIEPKAAPKLADTGGRRQLTSTSWEKSSTGVDVVAIGQFNGQYTTLLDINDNGLAVGYSYADTPEGLREQALSWKDGVFTGLGTSGGNISFAFQSNNAGVIVGMSQDASGRLSPAVWENGVLRSLPRLLGDFVFADGGAQSINEQGDIVGFDYGNDGIHAALWPATGGIVDLGVLSGEDGSYAGGINRDGTIIGRSFTFSTPNSRPTVWRGGTMSEIVLPPGARALNNGDAGQMFNDAGDFLAEIGTGFGLGSALVFRNGVFDTLPALPNAQAPSTQPYGLNEAGDVVGSAWEPIRSVAVLWSHDGTLTDLGLPAGMIGSVAHGINNRGLIVGQAHGEWTPGNFESGAVLWRVAVDVTPPTIGYSSHAARYAVDEHVSIACTATDTESGIASNTCASIDGDAYVFGLGPHTYSAIATDNAGNSASASTSFSVSVTFASLTNLTRRFVTNNKVADALVGNLRDAEAARAKGNAKKAEDKLNDYRRRVQAEVGKSITAERASILIELSRSV
jgi:probable HAF family extracellular repeat protein